MQLTPARGLKPAKSVLLFRQLAVATHTRKGIETLTFFTGREITPLQLTPARGLKLVVAAVYALTNGVATHTRKGIETLIFYANGGII